MTLVASDERLPLLQGFSLYLAFGTSSGTLGASGN